MSQFSTSDFSSQEWRELEATMAKFEKSGSAVGASLWKDSQEFIDEDAAKEMEKEEESSKADVPARRTRRSIAAEGTNYKFFTGQIPSKPRGKLIHEIHNEWYYDYDLLEEHHGYIQWLFPVFEGTGTNPLASPLTKEEARLIRRDFNAACRFIMNYRMLLNFYGMILVDENTGKIARHPEIWQSRYYNLTSNPHNFLRINRILTCLGHMGFHRWRKPFLQHLEQEVNEDGVLAPCKYSFENFWKKTIEVNTRAFVEKTLELPEDREESVFFYHLRNQTKEYKQYKEMLREHEKRTADARMKANRNDIQQYQQLVARKEKQKARNGNKDQDEPNAKRAKTQATLSSWKTNGK